VFGDWASFLVSDKMKRLRVLDLEDTNGVVDTHLEEMVKQLTRLKFLSLRGCKGINRLPESIGGMRQLQTLDVRHTSIVMLPPEICKLAMLQYIHAGNTEPWYEDDRTVTTQPGVHDEDWTTTPPQEAGDNRGVEVPTGIRNLTALHTLGVVNVSAAGGQALLKELEKLTQMRGLKVTGVNRGNIQQFFSAITGHRHLESLSVRLEENMQNHILQTPGPLPKNLRNLKLYGEHALNLTLWIEMFQSVKFWDIEMVITAAEDLRPLQELLRKKNLRRLCVKLVQDGELHLDLLNCQSIKFQNLKIDCSSKSKVTFTKTKLVEVLKVRCYRGSDLRFSGLENLKSLKEVWLIGYCSDTFKQNLKQQLSNFQEEKKPVIKLVQSRSS
jgi:Leucine-rich repeat (LRR) protein